jgi:hypothetical protein
MPRVVNVHYVEKEAFFSNNADYVDNNEEVMVFVSSPTYVEVVARVREVLKWMNSRDMVELEGRYDVGPGHKTRMKCLSSARWTGRHIRRW